MNRSFSAHRVDMREKCRIYPLLFLLSFLFLLIQSHYTSPLFRILGGDSNIFASMGHYLLSGQTPYVDYFDHKGPMLIFFEAFGQYLFSDLFTGNFILEILFLAVTLILMYRIGRYYLSVGNSFLIIFLTLLYFAFTIEGGRMCEQYCLPFIMLPVYYTVKFIEGDKMKLSVFEIIAIGACSAIVFWVRLNNLACICACWLYVFIWFVKTKDWKQMKNLLLFSILGFLLVSAPILIYFYYKQAFDEMIYATFTFNFMYTQKIMETVNKAKEFSTLELIRIGVVRFAPLLVILSSATIAYFSNDGKKRSYVLLMILMLLFTVLSTQTGILALHYMTSILPAVALGFVLLLSSMRCISQRGKVTLWLNIVCILLLLVVQVLKIRQNQYYDAILQRQEVVLYELITPVPKEDYDKIYPYNVFCLNSPKGDFFIKPYYRYVFSQNTHGYVDNRIFEGVNDMMQTNPPKWLVQGNVRKDYNPRFSEIVKARYSLVKKVDSMTLYRLND